MFRIVLLEEKHVVDCIYSCGSSYIYPSSNCCASYCRRAMSCTRESSRSFGTKPIVGVAVVAASLSVVSATNMAQAIVH